MTNPISPRKDTGEYFAPRHSAEPEPIFVVSALRASVVFRKITDDQEHRWSHLIEFAESQREDGLAKAAVSNQ